MKRLSVRKTKLLETVTYIAIKERLACIITVETVMCIMHCRKYNLHNCNRNSICIITTKIVNHIFHLHMCSRNFQLHNCNRNRHLLNCNRKIHQDTSNKKYHLRNLTTETLTYRNGASLRFV